MSKYLRTASTLGMLLVITSASAGAGLVVEGALPRLVGEGYNIAEGPAADGHGNVYFTDALNGRVMKMAADGTVSVFLEHADKPGGMRLGSDGSLYACELGARRVARYSPGGDVATVADRCEGKRFNSPNDLWIDRKGGIYFTDPVCFPDYALEADGRNVYYIKPGHVEVIRVVTDIKDPNGIIGTPDGKKLYVADFFREVKVFDVNEDGTLSNGRVFASRGSDGMAVDVEGHVYLTGPKNVSVYDAAGVLLEEIPMPEITTNLAFFGPDRKKLFITTFHAAYTLDMNVAGGAALASR